MTRKPTFPAWLLYAFLATATILIALYFTRGGPGITGDSVHYVMGAENLLAGRGFSRTAGGGEALPITGFPPGTSWMLYLVGLFTDNLFDGARVLNSLFFGLNVFIVAQIVRWGTRSNTAGFIAGIFIMLSEDLILLHGWVMSEPQFILVMLLALWALARYLVSGEQRFLLLCGVLIAGATLTRYVGASIGPAAALLLLAFGHGNFWRRIRDVALLALISGIPLLLWLWRNAQVSGTLTNRALDYFPLSNQLIQAFLGTMNAWIFPLPLGLSTPVRAIISTIIVVGLIGFYITGEFHDRRKTRDPRNQQQRVLARTFFVFLPAYVALLLINSMFLDASTSPAGAARYLAPMYVALVVLLSMIIARLIPKLLESSSLKLILSLVAVLVMASYFVRAVMFVREPGPVFRYTDTKNEIPDVVTELAALDAGQVIISNDIELVYVLVDRPAYAFPLTYDHYRKVFRDDLDDQIDFVSGMLENDARVIYFGEIEPYDRLVLDLLEVVIEHEFESATLFKQGT